MKTIAFALLLLASAASAQENEDAAHRADRLETRRLNQRSSNGYAAPGAVSAPASDRAYRKAREEYRQRLEMWRRRVAACEAGDDDACR